MRELKEKRIWKTYIWIEIVIFLVMIYTMVMMDHTVYDRIQFVLIAINFTLMVYFLKRYNSEISGFHEYAISAALTMTLIADVFTCLIPEQYVIGVIAFCIVQTIYMIYLGVNLVNLLSRVILYIVLFIVFKPDELFMYFGCYSMANLVVNVVTVWRRYATLKKANAHPIAVQEILIFAIGISCFLGCDSSIAIRGMIDSQSVAYLLINLLAWIFYTPSQILINTSRFISYPNLSFKRRA